MKIAAAQRVRLGVALPRVCVVRSFRPRKTSNRRMSASGSQCTLTRWFRKSSQSAYAGHEASWVWCTEVVATVAVLINEQVSALGRCSARFKPAANHASSATTRRDFRIPQAATARCTRSPASAPSSGPWPSCASGVSDDAYIDESTAHLPSLVLVVRTPGLS